MHNAPVKLAMELGVRAWLAWVLATAMALQKYNRQRRDDYEQHEQWLAAPSEKVEQVGGQEHRRGEGDRQIPDSPHFWLLLAVALLAMLDFYSMTVMGWAWFALVGSKAPPQLSAFPPALLNPGNSRGDPL